MEVGPLSRRGCDPCPCHYGRAFACSIIFCPHSFRLSLRRDFPVFFFFGRNTGLPRFAQILYGGLGPICTPAVRHLRTRGQNPEAPDCLPFWLEPISTFGSFLLTMLTMIWFSWPYLLSSPLIHSARIEVALSRELCTFKLLQTHILVELQSRICSCCFATTRICATSCRTLT